MRTLEQIKKEDYENLTYGELCEYDINCDRCPLYDEFCSGGMVCYGAEPIEPPCYSFNEDTVLQEEYDRFFMARHRQQQIEDEREEKLKLKKQKSEERKKKLLAYRIRNGIELYKIKELKKKIKQENRRIEMTGYYKRRADAVNIANKIFKECNQPNDVADINTKPYDNVIDMLKENIKNYELEIAEIRKQIKQKEKTFKQEIKTKLTKEQKK